MSYENVAANGEPEEKKRKLEETGSLGAVLSNLKQSEFYNKNEIAELKKESFELSKAKSSSKGSPLLINPKQRGNKVIKYITSVPYEYVDIVPDYVPSKSSCILFLSLRYHQLNPDYIHERLKILGSSYTLRVLLAQVDVPEPHHSLKNLTRICLLANLTLMLAWSPEEAGKIIEMYKVYETKPPDMIMEKSDSAPLQKLSNALTSVRSVNKTDATNFLTTFKTLEGIINAPVGSLALCHGVGHHKAQRLYKTLHEPFLREKNN
ncbi:DNA excision repair protein ERCC-1 [Copidosoma floridanum]|uniref:DNA excision repair protein ERCC-1 n=1 Tax=Copidosoma floridanum TaxID=29053 RepID=UPI0006C99094|nr:DNA excision repair protein ERCC-1 [Copidosoma floridanum]